MSDTIKFYVGRTEVACTNSRAFDVEVTASGCSYDDGTNKIAFERFEADVTAAVTVNAQPATGYGYVTIDTINVASGYGPFGPGADPRVTGGLEWVTSGTHGLTLTFTPPAVANHDVTWDFRTNAPPVLFKAKIKRRP